MSVTTSSELSYLSINQAGPWGNFVQQLERVKPHLPDLEPWFASLERPERSLIVDVPVRMDNGNTVHFEAYRVLHNTARGPGKGGVRYHPSVNLPEVMALAAWMSVKNATLNLPFGGAKGGVRVDPHMLSHGELERLTRRYTQEIAPMIGPDIDIPAPDVGTNQQVMAWMADSYGRQTGLAVNGVVTGKPVELGGSLGRQEATGRGVFTVGQLALTQLKMRLPGARVAVQGLGNVGSVAARLFSQAGAKVVAVQDRSGAIFSEGGLDIDALLERKKNARQSLADLAGTQTLTTEAFWEVDCDILIPAALEGQLTEHNASRVKARLILEGANGPTTPQADDIFQERGVLVVPDVLANAGGVTVSYFEWVQNKASYYWSEQEVNERLGQHMAQAFAAVWQLAHEKGVSLRTAAYLIGCSRILRASELRGL